MEIDIVLIKEELQRLKANKYCVLEKAEGYDYALEDVESFLDKYVADNS